MTLTRHRISRNKTRLRTRSHVPAKDSDKPSQTEIRLESLPDSSYIRLTQMISRCFKGPILSTLTDRMATEFVTISQHRSRAFRSTLVDETKNAKLRLVTADGDHRDLLRYGFRPRGGPETQHPLYRLRRPGMEGRRLTKVETSE